MLPQRPPQCSLNIIFELYNLLNTQNTVLHLTKTHITSPPFNFQTIYIEQTLKNPYHMSVIVTFHLLPYCLKWQLKTYFFFNHFKTNLCHIIHYNNIYRLLFKNNHFKTTPPYNINFLSNICQQDDSPISHQEESLSAIKVKVLLLYSTTWPDTFSSALQPYPQ